MTFPQPPSGSELLTVQEVADWLRVCPQTVRRYIRAGDLYAWNVGSLYKVPYFAVMKFLEDQKNKRM